MSGLEKSQIPFQQSRVKASDILTMECHRKDKIQRAQLKLWFQIKMEQILLSVSVSQAFIPKNYPLVL